MPSVLWRGPGNSTERCLVESTPAGWRIAGTTLLTDENGPVEIRYSVILDDAWRTLTVGAHVQSSGADRRMALSSDGNGTWSVTDQPVLELFGAIDVDLAWTPVSRTIAIRRLNLEVGESAATTVARIGFPGHDIDRAIQQYERLDEHRYRFVAGDSTTVVTVGDASLVSDHDGTWIAVSTG